MRRFLLDTNAASDYIFRRRGVRERAMQARANGAKIGIGLPVVADFLAESKTQTLATRTSSLSIGTCIYFAFGLSRWKQLAYMADSSLKCGDSAGQLDPWI